MSNLIIKSSLPNNISARTFANSVFPTPVGPKKTKLPIGRTADFNPALPRLTAWETEATAPS